MGDVPVAYIDTVGGVRVSEDDVIVSGKNDVSDSLLLRIRADHVRYCRSRLGDRSLNSFKSMGY